MREAKHIAVKSKTGYILSSPINGLRVNPDHRRKSMMKILGVHKVVEPNLEKFGEVEAGLESNDKKYKNEQFKDVYEANCICYHGYRYVAK